MNATSTTYDSVTFLSPTSCIEDVMREYKRLFRSRPDAYAVQQNDGSYRPVRRPLSDKVLYAHLHGRITVGLYLITPVQDTCWFTVIDVDHKSPEMALSLITAARASGLADDEFLLEGSGNKGFHFWIFASEPAPAKQAMQLGQTICQAAGLFGRVEIFPKQAHVPAGGFGNLIRLPGRHAVSGKYSRILSADLQHQPVEWLRNIKQISFQHFRLPLAAAPGHAPAQPLEKTGSTITRKTIPCIEQFWDGVQEGNRNFVAYRLAIFLKDHGFPLRVALASLGAWNEHNGPPLGSGELNGIIQQVYRKDYHGYGCSHSEMQQFCTPESCPIALARQRAMTTR